MNNIILNNDERAIFALRSIYEKYGYAQYKMSKFEEYELYVRNKDFLISDSVITFTDTNGRLMALKPDVTLSIIKNSKDRADTVQKVYYNENVYRVSKGTHSFKEIMQVGLECVGAIDDYCISEVLMLAAESLRSISDDCVLDISHLDIISKIIDACPLQHNARRSIMKCIGEKNVHELARLCEENGIDAHRISVLKELTNIYGKPCEVLPVLRKLTEGLIDVELIDRFEGILDTLNSEGLADILRIDFSVVNDIGYYNGIVFKGFVEGIPTGILSGGQYNRLLEKMHRSSGAIGFAVYLDLLERMGETQERFDTDILLIYNENSSLKDLHKAIRELSADGSRVTAQRAIPDKLKYRTLCTLNGNEVTRIEEHA